MSPGRPVVTRPGGPAGARSAAYAPTAVAQAIRPAAVRVVDDPSRPLHKVLGAAADLSRAPAAMAWPVEDRAKSVVIGTVLGEAVFNAMRRPAHVDASARWYGTGVEEGPGESEGPS
ncbi:hypothetical protein [Streptomyces sp. NPDC018584]|uniref:hypothetical protein n=1 Tax=unclassified Streptomyces TaxID=2593676 RepID=UPI0037A306E9